MNWKILLSSITAQRLVALQEIVRLEGEGNYTKIKLASGEAIQTSKPLKFFEETLPGEQFFRLHQSHIVNLDFVQTVVKGDEQKVRLSTGDAVPLARRKRDGFVVWLGRGVVLGRGD